MIKSSIWKPPQSAKTTTAIPTTDVVDLDIKLEVLTKWIHKFPNPKKQIPNFHEIFDQSDSDENQIKRPRLSLIS